MKSISDHFIREALKTESPITPELINRLSEPRTIRLLHASMGLVTEAAEIMDAMKKFIFYGKDLDLVNIAEELGDSDWYKAIAHDEIGRSFEEIWAMVIKKLQMRYKGNFNAEGAINRDLDAERATLESSNKQIVELTKTELEKEEYDRRQNESILEYGTRVHRQLEERLLAERLLIESLPKEKTNTIRPEKEAGTFLVKDEQLEIKIFDQSIVHWLADTDTLRVLCNEMKKGDKFTLDENFLSCQNCIALLKNGSDF